MRLVTSSARQQHHDEGENHAQAGQMKAHQDLRLVAVRQQHQRAVHQGHEEADHPDGGDDGQPHQRAGHQQPAQTYGALAALATRGSSATALAGLGFGFGPGGRLARRCLGRRFGGRLGALRLARFGGAGTRRFGAAWSPACCLQAWRRRPQRRWRCRLALRRLLGSPARLRLDSLSDLKSVSYQPPPLRRNTGAEISFFMLGLPQDGHFFSGASLIFCMTSV